jgi:hypothetical protein
MRRWWAWAAASRRAEGRAMRLTGVVPPRPRTPGVGETAHGRGGIPPELVHFRGSAATPALGSSGLMREMSARRTEGASVPLDRTLAARPPAVRRRVARPAPRPRAQRQPRDRPEPRRPDRDPRPDPGDDARPHGPRPRRDADAARHRTRPRPGRDAPPHRRPDARRSGRGRHRPPGSAEALPGLQRHEPGTTLTRSELAERFLALGRGAGTAHERSSRPTAGATLPTRPWPGARCASPTTASPSTPRVAATVRAVLSQAQAA